LALIVFSGLALSSSIRAQPITFRDETGANAAAAKYGASGAGVTVVIMDRGIDWDHPDFINPDGTSRIQWLYDMSPDHPQPVEFSRDQINAALAGGPTINSRDAVGHGTVTAGLAVGNGSAVSTGDFRGMAPEADLIVIKVTSEGAPTHDDQPAEAPFIASYTDALDWLDGKLNQSTQPVVGIFNSGVQFGPIDGSSAISRKIDEVFGADRPGRVYVAPSGDEGNVPNHARATFDNLSDTVIGFEKTGPQAARIQLWYTGATPAEVTINFDDGTSVGPVGPGEFLIEDGITLFTYEPGNEPGESLQSDSGDRFVFVEIIGHVSPGNVNIRGTAPGTGTVDLYSQFEGNYSTAIPFTDHLTSGRLTDFAATESAIVSGAHVLLTEWVDVDGIPRQALGEGAPGELWLGSSGGPTRDGRTPGVDITASGHNAFAAYAQESYWATFRFNVAEESEGWYGRGGATSGSAPVVVGAVALLLEAAPDLTADQVRDLLRTTAVTDAQTGATPNVDWGYGKLDILAALDEACARGWASDGYCSLGITGDYNDDGTVNAADYVIWRNLNGQSVALPNEDPAATPGSVTEEDYIVWVENFGSAAPGSSSSTDVSAVPEPRTLLFTVAGLSIAVFSHRFRTNCPA
jgi:hypothetical protein